MLWAVTSYFNPCRYARRLQNYHAFRRRLHVPLLTVEWDRDGVFQLGEDDADALVQISGGDVMWQKERLLNIGIGRLPAACDKVAWLDCDLIFEDDDWANAASAALERYPVIQPFARSAEVHSEAEMGNGAVVSVSLGKALVSGHATPDILRVGDKRPLKVACGLAWAARREILEQHGLYDRCVMGCGDGAVIAGSMGNFDDLASYLFMNRQRADHFRRWAEPFYARVRGNVGFSEGKVYHLWHGSLEDRHYLRRRVEFAEYDFDPACDVTMEDTGCWRWNSPKPAMHAFVKDYFSWRREDG